MRLVVDRVIADAATAFAPFGEIVSLDGRQLGPADVRDADVLLVRSVTRVDEALLADSCVRFVGTATAGTDHIDIDYLSRAGIAFSAAPGCNARPVGEYVLSCVLAHAADRQRPVDSLRCGLIGVGHAGSAARRLLAALGVECVACDPPRARREGTAGFVSLAEVLACDVVSLHVPLTRQGPDATHHLLDAAALAQLPDGALLINAARGGIVDEAALLTALRSARFRAALDCWQDEPAPSAALVADAWIATPHVAGHSVDARERATVQLRTALAHFLGVSMPPYAPPAPALRPTRPLAGQGFAAVHEAVMACCDPLAETPHLKALAGNGPAALASGFDALRARAGQRREFPVQPVAPGRYDPDTARLLEALDFHLEPL